MQHDLPGTAPITQGELAKRRASAPLRAAKPQKPCDVGLFSDEAAQLDLVERVRDDAFLLTKANLTTREFEEHGSRFVVFTLRVPAGFHAIEPELDEDEDADEE